ncbi:outer membrane lipid asymmetry maintenance protein MlaD [Methylococcus capsulatus]|nr:outer membrane lipid asymmetry maintenance protein MlaD [Methylococcus capsulatus]QXP91239.1 outer membrane lipid asymmetry maintenance protein MlaD [Methylococcus capsulatus]
MHSKTIEIWVGIFVALGLASLFLLAMKVSNLSEFETGAEGYRITARFQNVGSLKPRAAVSMGGVRIGRVTSVSFDKKSYEAVVEMRIDRQYDTLPDDTSASILTAGLLGEQYVGLTPGGSDDYLADGGQIELTQSALVLEEVVSRFLFDKAEGGDKSRDESGKKK